MTQALANDRLNHEIAKRVRRGYTVTQQGEASASLVKPKTFSLLAFVLLLLLGGVPGLLYVLYFAVGKRDRTVYLMRSTDGDIEASDRSRLARVWQRYRALPQAWQIGIAVAVVAVYVLAVATS
jgi:hypothetical protein